MIQIDEAKIGKRKYHVGRVVEGSWIIGMVDMQTNEIRFEILPGNQRDMGTLMSAIEKHVLPQFTIMTDQWLGYLNLSRPQTPNDTWYNHLTVNHTYNFVDPLTGANTQMIESNWRALKKRLCRGGVHKNLLAFHLCEYLWRRYCTQNQLDPFGQFIRTLALIHQPRV